MLWLVEFLIPRLVNRLSAVRWSYNGLPPGPVEGGFLFVARRLFTIVSGAFGRPSRSLVLTFIIAGFSAPSAWSDQVNVMVVAIYGEAIARKEWQPTLDYLQAKLPQHQFELTPVPIFDQARMRELIAKQQIDFVITQPAIYVALELEFGISRILTMVQKEGISEFGSAIITRADSGIHTIQDLHGKTVAGVDRLGFGGWLVGYKEMLAQGFDPYKSAAEVRFLGTQPEEVRAVLTGAVDAAVVRTGMLENQSREAGIDIGELRVLSPRQYPGFPFQVSTPLYPEWAFARTHKASNETSRAVALALLALDRDHPASAAAHIQGWTFPYDYQPVHDLLKSLKVGPYENYGEITMRDFVTQHKGITISFSILALLILFLTSVIYRANVRLRAEQDEKARAFEDMKHMATHDHLTGLCNRLLFMELLEKMVRSAKRRGTPIAIMFIDLDGFKAINDAFGHNLGDEVLRIVARTLTHATRSSDALARMGGDEFIVALSETYEIEAVRALALRVIEQISQISLPRAAGMRLGASIGVIVGTPGDHSAEDLIRRSDTLMYEAKLGGKGRCVLKPLAHAA